MMLAPVYEGFLFGRNHNRVGLEKEGAGGLERGRNAKPCMIQYNAQTVIGCVLVYTLTALIIPAY